LGIAGIAIGLAVKDSLANIFGGVSLILDRNFKIGDKIKLESGEEGVIKDIGLRSTRLLTLDNQLIIIPNGILSNAKIQNFVLPDPKERVAIKFGVEYGSDVKKVKDIVIKAVKNVENILEEPAPEVLLIEMGDFALIFVCRVWVNSYKNAERTKAKATEAIYTALNKAKIVIPYPTHTVYVKK